MYQIDFTTPIHIHFIGIGGISMSGLAEILLEEGFTITGSDSKESPLTRRLEEKGARVYYGQKASNIESEPGIQVVVYTAAIHPDNPEFKAAKEKNLPMLTRAELLGELMRNYKEAVAVSGTHGKTTTTSMITDILLAADTDPTISVGGILKDIGGNIRVGGPDLFVTEACEYKASFLKFYPYIGIILNIDADHLDYYRDINHIEDTFKKFSDLIPDDGYLVGCAEDPRVVEVLNYAKCKTLSYGFDKGDVTAGNISFNNKGCATFTVFHHHKELFDVTLSTTGRHNILNALATICTSLILEIPNEAVINGLAACKGAHKRFEYKGEFNGATIIDDYAHHPVEIAATLNTAKLIPHNKVYCVFQPHTYTRTKTLFDDFTTCFKDSDELILMDIYAAREKDTGLVSSDELGDSIRAKGFNCINLHSHEEVANYLKNKVKKDDLVLTVGAGDVVKVGELLLNS